MSPIALHLGTFPSNRYNACLLIANQQSLSFTLLCSTTLPSIHNAHYPHANAFSSHHSAPLIRFCKCLPTSYVCIASENPCAAVVAKYLTSTSSSCCSFSRLGRMLFVMRSVAFWQPWPGVPAFSKAITVPCSGSCFSVLTRTPYDFATLKRMLGISSLTSLSIIGRIDCSMTSRLSAGARVC
jgi:hypothetical protein